MSEDKKIDTFALFANLIIIICATLLFLAPQTFERATEALAGALIMLSFGNIARSLRKK